MIADKTGSRRRFLARGATGIAAAATAEASQTQSSGQSDNRRLPRQVWVAAVGQMGLSAKSSEDMCRQMLGRMEETLPLHPDIICTPEVFPFVGLPPSARRPLSEIAEQRGGPVLDRFSEFARQHACYVICSTYTRESGYYYIASVLFDRAGKYAGEYRKINPTDDELKLGITPGPLRPPVFETDFGAIGVQICYDINWYENWNRLGEAGAAIVFWPSAFAGGMMLNSLAWMNRYYVVASTRFEHSTKIVSPLGEDLAVTGRAATWVCEPVNLDVAVVQSVAHFRKFPQIRKKYGRNFRFRILHTEALAIVEGISGDVSVAQVMREFNVPTARQMHLNSTKLQNAKRPAGDAA